MAFRDKKMDEWCETVAARFELAVEGCTMADYFRMEYGDDYYASKDEETLACDEMEDFDMFSMLTDTYGITEKEGRHVVTLVPLGPWTYADTADRCIRVYHWGKYGEAKLSSEACDAIEDTLDYLAAC